MNINHQDKKKLKSTAKRAMVGAITISDRSTKFDPTGHLMMKMHSAIFNVNIEEFNEMLKEYNFTEEEGIAYLEVISSLPVIGYKMPLQATYIIENAKDMPAQKQRLKNSNGDVENMTIPRILIYKNAWPSSWEKVIKSKGKHAPVFWTKNEREYTSPRALNFKEANEINPKAYVMIPYEEYNSYTKVYNAFIQFISDNQESDEIHLWTQGVLIDSLEGEQTTRFSQRYSYDKMADELYDDISKQITKPGKVAASIETYWNSSILTSEDMYEKYANLTPPRRIPVIGFRVSNWGMRSFGQSRYPQIVPPSNISFQTGIPKETLIGPRTNEVDRYVNYSKFVRIRKITDEEIEKLDYAYDVDAEGFFMMREPKPNMYTIDNDALFNGFSSLCTSAHSTYGYGREPGDLASQLMREIETGHKTSGHMIASCLMYRAHLLLYLKDVLYNFKTEKSIYNLPVMEPTSGRYHTKQEYMHAIEDINLLMNATAFDTKHTRTNLVLLTTFVNNLS